MVNRPYLGLPVKRGYAVSRIDSAGLRPLTGASAEGIYGDTNALSWGISPLMETLPSMIADGGITYDQISQEEWLRFDARVKTWKTDSPDLLIWGDIVKWFLGTSIAAWVIKAVAAGVTLLAILQKLTSGEKPVVPPPVNGNGGIIAPPPEYDVGGPGIPEPRAGTYYKTWRIPWERRDGTNGYTWFWAMNDGFILAYTNPPGKWARWKPVKPIAVLGRKMNMNQFLKADRFLDRFARRLAKRSSKLKLQRG